MTSLPPPPATGDTDPGTGDGRITRADIEGKLAELRGGVDEEVANVRGLVVAASIVVAAVVVLGAFALGRRRGRRFSTIVEVRRV